MWALIAAVFVASVLGSLHCAGMCGAFLAFAVGLKGSGPEGPQASMWEVGRLQVGYHGGRLVTYSLLGAAAGGVGALVDLAGALAGLERVAMAIAGGMMVGFGVVTLMRLRGWKVTLFKVPGSLQRVVMRGQRAALSLTPMRRAVAIGLLTTLLPCGWLYAFAVTAAGTGSVGYGALTMSVFWAGTLPVMVSLGAGLRGVLGVMGRRVPALTCIAVIAVGLVTMSGRLRLEPAALAAVVEQRAGEGGEAEGLKAPSPVEKPACCELGALR